MARVDACKMKFASVYPFLLAKVEKKGRSKEELNAVILWLSGYSFDEIDKILESDITYEEFFANCPNLNPKRLEIKGVICGVRVEDMEDSTMKEIRILDKLVDELAKGKTLEKILNR